MLLFSFVKYILLITRKYTVQEVLNTKYVTNLELKKFIKVKITNVEMFKLEINIFY